ncbi:RNA binding protein, heterogenous nuclear RNP-K like protein [Tieghemiomyces parasiticus]|uniref:RNA binding protein, heterogenous nuclear RNP-K like protein n=1 Tax=Tieghemiomyces parasiticus TaxID=78921 RepID=A0A9W7ZRS3_9FUNG|nr:RNA binding protein, heterogenous nuclear RNP-K like protein [Tieghemiomyces parasiticus]
MASPQPSTFSPTIRARRARQAAPVADDSPATANRQALRSKVAAQASPRPAAHSSLDVHAAPAANGHASPASTDRLHKTSYLTEASQSRRLGDTTRPFLFDGASRPNPTLRQGNREAIARLGRLDLDAPPFPLSHPFGNAPATASLVTLASSTAGTPATEAPPSAPPYVLHHPPGPGLLSNFFSTSEPPTSSASGLSTAPITSAHAPDISPVAVTSVPPSTSLAALTDRVRKVSLTGDPADSRLETQLILRALVTSKEAGVIIGKNGSNVARLRHLFGVKAGVSKAVPSVPERILTVSGPHAQVAQAYALIAQGLLENPITAATAITGVAPHSGPRPPGPLATHLTTVRVLISHNLMGTIIGRQGLKIKHIQELSGARMDAQKEMLPQSTERVVEIQGTVAALRVALEEVGKCLIEDTERGMGSVLFNPATRVPSVSSNCNPYVSQVRVPTDGRAPRGSPAPDDGNPASRPYYPRADPVGYPAGYGDPVAVYPAPYLPAPSAVPGYHPPPAGYHPGFASPRYGFTGGYATNGAVFPGYPGYPPPSGPYDYPTYAPDYSGYGSAPATDSAASPPGSS